MYIGVLYMYVCCQGDTTSLLVGTSFFTMLLPISDEAADRYDRYGVLTAEQPIVVTCAVCSKLVLQSGLISHIGTGHDLGSGGGARSGIWARLGRAAGLG